MVNVRIVKLLFGLWLAGSTVLAAIVGIDLGSQFTKSVLLAPAVPFDVILTDEGSRKDPTKIQLFTDENLAQDYQNQLISLALLVDEVKERAVKHLGEKSSLSSASKSIIDVALNIPESSSQIVRQAYLDALSLANISNVLGVVEGGSAVALNFASNKEFTNKDKEYYMIYDAGAGSTKASLFSIRVAANGETIVEMESASSNDNIGGKVLTNAAYEIILQKALNHFGIESLPEKTLTRLRQVAEKAKLILSANNEFSTVVESIYGDEDFKVYITREEFEELNSDLMQQVTQPVLDALKEGGLKVEDVKSVIFNGGSTRVPFIQKQITSLFGDDKISKSVNTDESAALGTTQKGLQFKVDSTKGPQLIEKSFHNYEIGVNDSEEQILVFGKNSTLGSIARIEHDPVEALSLNLYEDGTLIKSFNFDQINDKLACKKDEKKLVTTFELDQNKLFNLVEVEVECRKQNKSFLGNLLKKKDKKVDEVEEEVGEEEEKEKEIGEEESKDKNEDTNDIEEEQDDLADAASNATDKNKTESTKPLKSKARKSARNKNTKISIPKSTYPHVKPLDRATRKEFAAEISRLHSLEKARLEVELVRNELESQIYKLRELLDENEEQLSQELSESDKQVYFDYMDQAIEWFDFDSDDSSVDDLKQKIKEVESKQAEVKKYVDMTKTDLSKEGMKRLYEDGTNLMMSIQSSMLKLGEGVAEMRKKYEEAGFNFDKENDKAKIKSAGQEDQMLNFDRNLQEYKEIITKVGQLVDMSDKKFNKIEKTELYQFHDMLAKGVSEMVLDLVKIESSHMERMKLFDEQYDKLVLRQQQKEYRKKMREAAKEAERKKKQDEHEEKEQDEDDDDVEEIENDTIKIVSEKTVDSGSNTISTSTDSSPETTSFTQENEVEKEDELEHDEL
ncbi:lumenal Hsp70 protein [Lodderomyces elongisporus]|uniref:lumenal Hsp70 protein n=1 Tax=Lodderomyces elongisporus TaxID=36914 RepID=UPI0029209C6F|nr:lumenal Hsp70 protein [Lodderomyces elongisporus]WLF77336.1 lumenal Hsp70 protein [Lodderomyces elongisporus]